MEGQLYQHQLIASKEREYFKKYKQHPAEVCMEIIQIYKYAISHKQQCPASLDSDHLDDALNVYNLGQNNYVRIFDLISFGL